MSNKLAFVLALLLAGCTPASDKPRASAASGPAAPIESDGGDSIANAAPSRVDAGADAETTSSGPLLADGAVGALIAKLSEAPGDFPSENYVSNETSLLDVAPTLRDAKLHGHAYVGVGPEQSYSYLAMLEPKVAYIVDIRRGNLLEHMFFRGCFEAGATRSAFVAALLSRRPTATLSGVDFAAAFPAGPVDKELRELGIARTKAVMDRLGVLHSKADDATIGRIQSAFAQHGLAIAYTMTREKGDYLTLGDSFAAKDPSGEPASFLATETSYARVRKLVVENRVIPIVGDFGGSHALRAVGDDMRERGIPLGVFYASNVEQYLFDGRKHAAFIASVRSMPRDDESRFVRVWFDPVTQAQYPRRRTTQLTTLVNPFLERAEKKPFRSYAEVVAQPSR